MSGHEDAIIGVIVLMPLGILSFSVARVLSRYTTLWNRWVYARRPWSWLGESTIERRIRWGEVGTLWYWRVIGASFVGLGFWMLIIDLSG